MARICRQRPTCRILEIGNHDFSGDLRKKGGMVLQLDIPPSSHPLHDTINSLLSDAN
jgi:hypothetical protein